MDPDSTKEFQKDAKLEVLFSLNACADGTLAAERR